MKTITKSIALIALAALSLSACSKKEAPINNDNEQITLKFNIKNADDTFTRALLGTDSEGNKFLDWEDGDQIGTFSTGSFSGGTSASNNNPGTVEVSGDSFTMNIQTTQPGSVAKFYSYYPYSSAAGKEKTAVVVTIPEGQNVTSVGYDADAMPMAGAPVDVDIEVAKANADTPCGTINFSNLGSIINFKVYSSAATDETLTSVKYITSGNVGGAFTIDLTGIDFSDENTLALTSKDPISAITTTCMTKPTIGTGKSNAVDVYMVVAPGTYANTQVVVTTSSRTYTLTASGEKTYARSHVKPMYVDIQNGVPGELPKEEVWEKVTKASDFTAGTYYILRGDCKYYLPNAVASGNAPALAAYTEGASISNAMKWNATEGTEGLIFESAAHSGNYLWGGNANNGVRVNTTSSVSNANKEWKFTTVTVDGTTYYTAYAYATRYLTSYGDQDWRNYTSASTTNIPAEFYKLIDHTPRFSVTSPLEATAGEGTYSVAITRNNFTGAINVSVPSDCDWVLADNVAANATSFDIMVSANAGADRTVTLTLSGEGVEPQELVINQAGALPGSEINPYSVAQALAAAGELAEGGQSTNEVYVSGIISKVDSYSSKYKSITYYISDDGTSTGEFEVYSGKGLEGAGFSAITDLAIGDEVVIKGYLKNYNGTLEVYQNNELVSITYATRYTITVASVENGTITASAATAGAQGEVSLIANPATGYQFDAWAVTNASTGAVITVTDDKFIMPAANVNVSATFTVKSSTDPTVESITSGTFTLDNDKLSLTTTSGVTIEQAQGTGSTAVNKSYNTVSTLRVYKGHTLTFSGKTFTRIEITVNGTYYGNTLTASSGTLTPTTTSGGTIVWEGEASSVTITNTATDTNTQLRTTSFSVTYN